jgi:hypothetical protein
MRLQTFRTDSLFTVGAEREVKYLNADQQCHVTEQAWSRYKPRDPINNDQKSMKLYPPYNTQWLATSFRRYETVSLNFWKFVIFKLFL